MYCLKWAYLGQLMLDRLFFQVKKVVFFSRIGTTSVLSATHRRNGHQTITNIGSDGARTRARARAARRPALLRWMSDAKRKNCMQEKEKKKFRAQSIKKCRGGSGSASLPPLSVFPPLSGIWENMMGLFQPTLDRKIWSTQQSWTVSLRK